MAAELVGPIRYHAIIIDGRQVPYLTGATRPGGIVELSLDNRISIDIPVADLERVGRFIADAIAVGMGYTAHPEAGQEPIARPPFPHWCNFDEPAR